MNTLDSYFLSISSTASDGFAARGVWHLILVFLARHWLLSVANAAGTMLLGLGLLRLLPRAAATLPGRRAFLFQDYPLRLLRLVCIAAMIKSAFFLILGDSHRMIHHSHDLVGYGVQLPDLTEMLHLTQQTPYTIWRPTTDTEFVGLFLGGVALLLLFWRAKKVLSVVRGLESLDWVISEGSSGHPKDDLTVSTGEPLDQERLSLRRLTERSQASLQRAADELGCPSVAQRIRLVVRDSKVATPILIGLRHPYIILAPLLVEDYTDEELDAVLRHELVHYTRRDHWWRWMLLWVEDIGSVNLLSHWLSSLAIGGEEYLCDRGSISSGPQAKALARGIVKSQAYNIKSLRSISPMIGLEGSFPRLVGLAQPEDRILLERRVQVLMTIANASAISPNVVAISSILGMRLHALLRGVWTVFIITLILLVVYLKFFLIYNVAP